METPRAALTANRIASGSRVLLFRNERLTQMTFGYSRDDIASFLPVYLEKEDSDSESFPGVGPERRGPAH